MDERLDDVTEKRIYPPANECIYCGAREVPLTDEHTFPDGMGGRHILPKACCKPCQKIINEQFEQYCQRTLFSHMRAVFGMKSQKKRKPVRHSIQVRTHSGEIKRIYGDPAELPLVIGLPAFPKPYFVTGQELEGDTFDGAWWRYCDPPIEQIVKDLGVASVITEKIWPERLARFVAKIAHAQAWARWGPVFDPYLPPIILGQDIRYIVYVGGSLNLLAPDNESGFAVVPWRKDDSGDVYLVAAIRLFAELGAPIYYAVIGKVTGPLPLQERQA